MRASTTASHPRFWQRRSRPGWWRMPLLVLLVLVAPLALIGHVALATERARYDDPLAVPAARVAVVFGAGVRPDGTPTPMLADRVRAAVQLYQTGRVGTLLMTGDSGRADHDEVSAMRRYAVESGVPADAIVLDPAGFSTYESCYRVRAVFGVTRAR